MDELGPAALREILRRVALGELLSTEELRRFSSHLAARERAQRSLLGRYAGSDPSFDTVSGRCGLPPRFGDLDT